MFDCRHRVSRKLNDFVSTTVPLEFFNISVKTSSTELMNFIHKTCY